MVVKKRSSATTGLEFYQHLWIRRIHIIPTQSLLFTKILVSLWTKNSTSYFYTHLSTSYPLVIHIFTPVNKATCSPCGFVDKESVIYCHFKANLISYCCFIWWISNSGMKTIHNLWITFFSFPQGCGNEN